MVDVVLNIFAKPYQTALSVLSLLRFCDQHIGRFFLQFEPASSKYDSALPYAISAWLGPRAAATQPSIWIECDAVEPEKLQDSAYRLALRYQTGFEFTDKRHLFIMHNDVLIKADVIGAMLDQIGDAFAIGHIGQCWNCPASKEDLVRKAGVSQFACTPATYADFSLTPEQLERLYATGREHGFPVRPYWEGWQAHYSEQAWPLPECRVNEWACLVDVQQVKQYVSPQGTVIPFGAFEACGSVSLDTAVAWFRDLNRLGLRAQHFDLQRYVYHFVGSHRTTRSLHMQAETEARELLEKHFPEFVAWCRGHKGNMFP